MNLPISPLGWDNSLRNPSFYKSGLLYIHKNKYYGRKNTYLKKIVYTIFLTMYSIIKINIHIYFCKKEWERKYIQCVNEERGE